MNSAFIEFAERFAPDELEEGFDRSISGSKLFSFMNKSKYWDLYRDLYPILTEKGGGRFPQMFGEEFVRAYERQVAEYQRRDREQLNETSARSTDQESDLVVTQKLVRKPIWAADSQAGETLGDDDAASETVGDDDAADVDQLDQSFIDELDNSMAEDISQDQLKA